MSDKMTVPPGHSLGSTQGSPCFTKRTALSPLTEHAVHKETEATSQGQSQGGDSTQL